MRWSASQPPIEKSPSDPPVPRKLNVKTSHPTSRAMRSASSGKVSPDASEPRGGVGKSWHSTSAGTDAVVAGRATWAASASPSTSIRSSTAAPLAFVTIILGRVTTTALRAPAFKEWAVVVQALLEGEQILDVRKGGIREDGRHFSVQATRLWLYPTVEHQRPELLKPAYRRWIDRRPTAEPADRAIRDRRAGPTSSASRPRRIPRCSTRSTARSIWSREYVETRFKWKKRDPLWVLALRVHRLDEPIAVPYRDEYGGCTSWVDLDGLPDDPASLPSEPVLSDVAFAAKLKGAAEAIPGGFDPPTVGVADPD